MTKLLSALLTAGLLMAGVTYAADAKKPCCDPTVEAGKACKNECCKKSAEKGKVCKKCHPAKKGEKAPAK